MKEHDPKEDRKSSHLLLLAENETGYKNLLQIASAAQLEGFYYYPAHRQGIPGQTRRGPDLHLRLHVRRSAAPDQPGPGRGRPAQPGLVLRGLRQGQFLLRTPAARRSRPGDGQPHPDGTGTALPGPLSSPPTTPTTSIPKTPNTRISCLPSRPGPCSPTPTGCA